MTLKIGENFRQEFSILQADLIANNGYELVAPADGFIESIDGSVQSAVTTGGTISVKTGPALANVVAGIAATVANAATKGTRFAGVLASTAGSNTRQVAKGDRVVIFTAGFATAGSIQGFITYNPSGAR